MGFFRIISCSAIYLKISLFILLYILTIFVFNIIHYRGYILYAISKENVYQEHLLLIVFQYSANETTLLCYIRHCHTPPLEHYLLN